MITKNEMQLKARIKNKALETGITPQAVLQIYCLERLLDRISQSGKKDCFIIKGGFLISSMIGIENRSTMDIDATVKNLNVDKENIASVFKEICGINTGDQLTFTFDRVEDIRENDEYPGIRVFLKAEYGKIKTQLTVDVTTGDSIIPSEIKYSYNCIFDEKTISVFAYPLENILAEKLETVVSRGKANTRPRDYYDIHILYSLKKNGIDYSTLKKALESTATKRGSLSVIKDYAKILDSIRKDEVQKEYWKKYISKNNFAKGITFEQVMDSVENLFNDFSLS